MIPSSFASAAVLILQQSTPAFAQGRERPSGVDLLVAAANGASVLPSGNGMIQAKGRITEAMFSPNTLDPVAMKVDLMERLGKEFGLSVDDFESQFMYGMAIKQRVDELKRNSDWTAITAIEKNLGLDELGVSLDTLVNAIIDPGSDDSRKLDAALKEKAGELALEKDGSDARDLLAALGPDQIGLYGY